MIPANELQRMAALRSLGLLDTPVEERFDRITRLAQRLFGVPISLFSLVDENRQWFKSRQGLDATETSRAVSFCGHAINGDVVFQVPDATGDERFADNPLVVGDPSIRFYAGCPVAGPDGSALGTLCVIDRVSRTLSDEEVLTLSDLADMVEREIAASALAITDELTGLSNRRGLHLLGQKVLDVCARQRLPASLVSIDVNGLKKINDQQGHAVGDLALREVADVLGSAFRLSDVIARVGGDEFVALLSATISADVALDRLRHEFAVRNAMPGARYQLSVSAGNAAFDPEYPATLDQLLELADAEERAEKAASRSVG